MKSGLLRFVSAIAVLACTASTVAQGYAVKLFWPKTAGLKYHVTGRATQRDEENLVVSSRTNHTENAYDLDFAAEAEVFERAGAGTARPRKTP